jgi:glyoxylase-like metal-dependent hydrolase (beta-lactamase superfamily II)
MPHVLTACPVAVHEVPTSKCFFGRDDDLIRDLAFYVWIVRGDDGGVGLIDSGLPPDPGDFDALRTTGVYRDVTPLADVLAAEGLTPERIDWCCITQPVTYHSGGIVPELLPRAQVYLSRAGMTELLCDPPGHPPTEFFFTARSWAYLRDLAIEGRLRVVDEPTEVAPGVVFETTGGHHPGSAGVRVQTASEGLVGILETAFLQENVDAEIPVGISEHVAECRRAIKRWKRTCDVVLADHEPSLAQRYGGAGRAGAGAS